MSEEQELLQQAKKALAGLELTDIAFPKDRPLRLRVAYVTAIAMISAGLSLLLECLASGSNY